MQPIPLWPVMFYTFQWQDHNTHSTRLKEICYELESQKYVSNVAPSAKHGLYESGFDFVKHPDPAVQALSHWTKDCFFKTASAVNKPYWPPGMNVSIEIHESWCHVTKDGGYHDLHIHPNSSWSAIYYLDAGETNTEEKNGVNRFFCPYTNMYSDAGTTYQSASTNVDILPADSMLVIFPSWVQHSALPYRGTKDRIVIAMNCKITKSDLTSVTIPI